jgi:hypothetical protein
VATTSTAPGAQPDRHELLPVSADVSTGARWRRQWLPTGWPLFCSTALFGVWWLLGLGSFVFVVFAIPMTVHLMRLGRVRVPPWFGLWLLYLIWSVAGIVVIAIDAPNTLHSSFSHAFPGFMLRTLQYLAATVVLLYVGNLTEAEVPRLRITRWLGVLYLTALLGGFVALVKPTLQFTSPMERVLPHALASNPNVASLFHPAVAQVMSVIGTADARPKAPFEYTNSWGNNLSVLMLWFLVAWFTCGLPKRRFWSVLIVAASIVPVIYSLNRGLWLGLIFATVYIAFRLARRGRSNMLVGLAVGAAVLIAAFVVTPLGGVVQARLNEGHSNQVRQSLTVSSIQGALTSPVIGYGTTREGIGSAQSVAVGQTSDCPRCGNRTIGSNGQLWNVLFSQGYVGAALFVGFLVMTAWAFRRDATPIGLAGQSTVLLALFYMLVYVGISSSLSILMLSIGLLWRNRQAHLDGVPDPKPTP